MIWFNQRRMIVMNFKAWCQDNELAECYENFVVFLIEKGWINEEKISEEIIPPVKWKGADKHV